jgi:hypothetical protein
MAFEAIAFAEFRHPGVPSRLYKQNGVTRSYLFRRAKLSRKRTLGLRATDRFLALFWVHETPNRSHATLNKRLMSFDALVK